MKRAITTVAVLAAISSNSPAEAQRTRIREVGPTTTVGINLTAAIPVGEFDDFIDFGGGLGLNVVRSLNDAGTVGIRFEGGFLIYGSETIHQPLSPTIQRVFIDVTTTNTIASFGLGPQFILGNGPIRPYIYGTIGFSYFSTQSSVGDHHHDDSFASSTNFDDFTFSTATGGGLLIRLSNGRKPVSLDLAVEYLQNGETSYLRDGSIRERPDGSITFRPITSDANVALIRVGMSIGIF